MKNILKHGDFMASIHFDSSTELLYGKVEGIDDSLTFEGNSVDELKIAFTEAIEDYIDICSKIGKNPHRSYKGSFNIRIKSGLHKKAAFRSVELGISLNQLVEKAISNFIEG
ncbi:MAG: type II toxin-antitoxin system HicB family antitoxin [Bacteroidetes bacterium]|nr:MAG: type II toxin-antitoxin system HicB family antitoxin [Bacteroidota bacterium]